MVFVCTYVCVQEFAVDGLVNLVGGCCGSTPEHIRCEEGRGRGVLHEGNTVCGCISVGMWGLMCMMVKH